MKSFLFKISLYLVGLLIAHIIAAQFADGFTDAFYLRFTGPSQSHMILGTSRAAQGVRPEFIDNDSEKGSFFNYAFTLLHSPYGEVYRESITRKLGDEREGKFILTIDPWSISAKRSAPNDKDLFKDGKTELGKTQTVTGSPNYEYLYENYPNGWGKLILRKIKGNPSVHELHEDGWLEINVPMDSTSINKRTRQKLKEYEKNKRFFAPSRVREQELRKTIDFLLQRGQVYLVRLPIPDELLEIEKEYWPEFDRLPHGLSTEYDIPYYDMTQLPDTFTYIDGNHLYKESSISVSKLISMFLDEEGLSLE